MLDMKKVRSEIIALTALFAMAIGGAQFIDKLMPFPLNCPSYPEIDGRAFWQDAVWNDSTSKTLSCAAEDAYHDITSLPGYPSLKREL